MSLLVRSPPPPGRFFLISFDCGTCPVHVTCAGSEENRNYFQSPVIPESMSSAEITSFKSLYRKRAIPPCSCPHFAYSRFRYSTKTSQD
jgi:hypothetical protein